MSKRVLILENDVALAHQLSDFFSNNGCATKQRSIGESGLSAADCEGADLILMGLDLPSLHGRKHLVQLRQFKQVPVIVLASSGLEHQHIECLNDGADDFLSKPFIMEELFARAEAIFRRIQWSVHRCNSCGKTLVVDDLTLSRTELKAFYSGIEIPLTPIQFRLLWVLVENRNEVLSKSYLYQVVLERAFSRYDRSLDMHLSRVRKKLISSGMTPERFSTIHGKGYRFA
ncbi:MAG: response regulator transcription factor [Cellvibrionaceae bacterium]|nr:response regulator transcription factor [Cellvibrionaceae bacterium]